MFQPFSAIIRLHKEIVIIKVHSLAIPMGSHGLHWSLRLFVVDLHLLFVCCVKMVQFSKFVTCTQRDGNNQIQEIHVAVKYAERKLRPVGLSGNISCAAQIYMRSTTELYQ